MFVVRGRADPGRAGRPGPRRARRGGTPWHPHHIAERYGLLVIITLGEGLLGTTVALRRRDRRHGWTLDAALLGLAGIALTFGMWWIYFVIPSGDLLHAHRARVVRLGLRPHPALRRDRRRRRRPARRGVLPRAPLDALRDGDAADGGDPAGGLLRDASSCCTPQLTRTFDPFHVLAARRHRRGGRWLGRAAVRGRAPRCWSPARAGASPVGDRGRLRDRRPPPQRGGAGGAAGH